MLTYVFVGQNRVAAVVDDKSKFAIDGVPGGAYGLAAWNLKLEARRRW
jgi:hypothetical protein